MKRKMILILSLVMLACIFGRSQGRAIEEKLFASEHRQVQNDKTKIKKEDLPQTARNILDGNAFKGWTVENVYKLSNGEFEVELKKGSASQTIRFNKDGKVK